MLKLKRGQTQKHIHSSHLYHQKAALYLNSNQTNQALRNVSVGSYNKDIDRLRGYQKEIEKTFAKRKPDQKTLGIKGSANTERIDF